MILNPIVKNSTVVKRQRTQTTVSKRRISFLAATIVAVLVLTTASQDAAGQPATANKRTGLGLQDTRFTLNGQPTFLLGISYYGALGASEDFIRCDLDDLQRHGFNWLRVWATWAAFDHDVSAVNAQGGPREPFLGKLQWLVAECDRRGLVVDVTLTPRACLAMAKALGRVAPVHHQEPFRRGYGQWEPTATDFLTDLRGAVGGGAAGWCFHNGSERGSPENQPRRSFDLRAQRLFEQLDSEEQKVVAGVKAILAEAR